MAKRYSLRARIGYRFDNLMSQGTSAKLRLLLVVTIAYIVIMGLITALLALPANGDVLAVFWNTAMYVIGKASPSIANGDSPLYLFLALLSVFYCLFFTAILIGLINQGIRSQMDKISKGTGKVLEDGHVLILGYNDATLVLLEQLIEANRNQAQQRVVILDETDWQEMTDAIRLRFGRASSHPQTKIMCRTGAIFGFDDLRRCSIETSRVVIVNGDNDFENVRAIIACSHLLGESGEERRPYLVSVIHDSENIAESSAAIENAGAAGVLEYLPLNETLARIMVHTSRKPGLSDVFTELFNYENDEFYIVDDDAGLPTLHGKSISEINLMLKASFAVGVCRATGEVVIDAPHSVVFNEGDSLIVAKEDDEPLVIADKPVAVHVEPVQSKSMAEGVNILVIGARPMLGAVLEEYAHYLHEGSTVHIADSAIALGEAMDDAMCGVFEGTGVSIVTHELDISKGIELNRLLVECAPDSVLVLVDHDAENLDKDDERTVRILVYLREYRRKSGKHFSITSEIHRALNKDLVSMTGPDDFIISAHIAALLMAQVSQRREMASVFRELLSSEGFEVYMRKASRYVCLGRPLDLHTVSWAVADKGEVFIGFRIKRNGKYDVAEVNPSKYVSDMQTLRKYTFGEDDYFVVLAELNEESLM